MSKKYQIEQRGEHFRNRVKRRLAFKPMWGKANVMVAGLVNQGFFIPLVNMGDHKAKHLAGKYNLPGGKVETHETYPKAMSRELEEETGLKIDSSCWHVFAAYDYQDDNVHNLIYFMRADITKTHRFSLDRVCHTVEPGHTVKVDDWRRIVYGGGFRIMENLRFLIPMGMYIDGERPVDIPYIREDNRTVTRAVYSKKFLMDV